MLKHRFAVTGAQGTGKSTLARDLYAACKAEFRAEVQLLEGIGSAIQQLGLPLGVTADVNTLYAFITCHFQRERLSGSQIVVQDRCMLDLYAYARLRRPEDRLLLEMIRELTINSLSHIDAVFFVPISPERAECSSQNETSEFRSAINQEILVAATSLGCTLRRIDGDPRARLASAIAIVAQCCSCA